VQPTTNGTEGGPRPSPPGGGRVASLDVLRATAVLLVLGRHLGAEPASEFLWLQQPLEAWVRGGWVGVDLFFVLSGFLIGGLLFREQERYGELHVGRFLVRRGLKIYPPFYALIAVTLVARSLKGVLPPTRFLLGELLYLQNYLGALWQHTWSLAVEEHFYLLLPIILLGIRPPKGVDRVERPFQRLPAVALLLMVGVLLLRLVTEATAGPYRNLAQLAPTHLRIDGLIFGVLLAWLHHVHPNSFRGFSRRHGRFFLVAGAALLLPPFLFALSEYPFMRTWGLTLNYMGSGCLLLAALGWEAVEPRRRGALAYIGLYSYSIYLWHVPVGMWFLPTFHRLLSVTPGSLASLALLVILSSATGIGAARLIEFPVLRMRDRFFPSRSGPLDPAPATGP